MESTKFVGMDVHKDAITIAVMNSAGKVIMESIIETKAVTILQSRRALLRTARCPAGFAQTSAAGSVGREQKT